MTGAVQTEAGRALAARFPFTYTVQTCCPYPHGEDSGPDIHPRHKRKTATETRSGDIAAIEAEAVALFKQGLAERLTGIREAFQRQGTWGIEYGDDWFMADVLSLITGDSNADREDVK